MIMTVEFNHFFQALFSVTLVMRIAESKILKFNVTVTVTVVSNIVVLDQS